MDKPNHTVGGCASTQDGASKQASHLQSTVHYTTDGWYIGGHKDSQGRSRLAVGYYINRLSKTRFFWPIHTIEHSDRSAVPLHVYTIYRLYIYIVPRTRIQFSRQKRSTCAPYARYTHIRPNLMYLTSSLRKTPNSNCVSLRTTASENPSRGQGVFNN